METKDILARLAALESENQALKEKVAARKLQGITCKVSEKGAVSVYGLQRFPITLYSQQWARLSGEMAKITAFIEANAAKLTVKPE